MRGEWFGGTRSEGGMVQWHTVSGRYRSIEPITGLLFGYLPRILAFGITVLQHQQTHTSTYVISVGPLTRLALPLCR